MRPGRLGRSAQSGSAAAGRHGLAPPERRQHAGMSGGRARPGRYTRPMSAPTPVRGARAPGQGRAGVLASASTAEKDAALLAAADLLERARRRRPRRQPARPRRRRGRRHGRRPARPPPPHRRPHRGRWPTGCARSPACPTRSARCSTAGAAPTACASSGVGSRSASSRSSTRTGPTSPATPPASASSRATPRCCAGSAGALRSNLGDRRRAARRPRPRPGSPPTRCSSSTTCATRPRSSSCSSPTSSTA